ncbi:acetyltransferase [Microcystis aeruginosa CS-567/02-A1]|uniref:acetyltransferase n=1 Tax=Microcystis aeruginosa TaxID=1126 RepID=UPI00232A84DA|nr:acetyltransferase [Microcystis aeruginosa]MDB9400337.1 acetyltransferase [Microcystis aeruginosa CS-567/02-A1]
MLKTVYILGAGGHGKVVLDTLLASHIKVTGVLTPQSQLTEVLGVPILGGDDYLNNVSITQTYLANGLGANPYIFKRRLIFNTMKDRGFTFKSMQHPSAIVNSTVKLGEGCQIMAGAIVQPGVTLGENTVVNTGVSIDHDCVISSHSFIAPGVTLCGDIKISHSVFIGAGAVVLPGVYIGENAIIGAGSVVTKSIPERSIVVGNPAVKIGTNHE